MIDVENYSATLISFFYTPEVKNMSPKKRGPKISREYASSNQTIDFSGDIR